MMENNPNRTPLDDFTLALTVEHDKWGVGRVLGTKELSQEEIKSGHPKWCVKVAFDNHGTKFVGTETLTKVVKPNTDRR